MAKSSKQRQLIDKGLTATGVIVTLVLLVVGSMALKAHSFVSKNVKDELTSQQIFFPPKDSPAITALPAANQAQMNKYAGQQLVNGDQAKVYANDFIAFHLSKVADGQTYAQVSTKAQADPTNVALQAKANTLFKGETLRGLLLGDAYAFWTVGKIAQVVAIASLAGAAVMFLLVLGGLGRLTLKS